MAENPSRKLKTREWGGGRLSSDPYFKPKALSFAVLFSILLAVSAVPAASAQTQSHPLSQVTPIDSNLDMFQRNITNVSYVGIGTTNPAGRLQVAGSSIDEYVRIENTGSGGNTWDIGTERSGGLLPTGAFFISDTDQATRLVIDSNGNIGIGATSPSGTLDVKGSILITGEASPTAGSGQVVFGKLSNDFYLGVASGEKLLRGFIGGNEKITIDESGKVGINTSSPSLPLHIQGTESRIRLESSAGRSYDIVSGGGGALFASSFGIQDSSASGAPLRLVIDSTGKVGLNESSPDYSLHITGVAPRTFVEGTRNGDNVAYIMQALASDGTARGGGYYLQPGTTDATTYLGLSADNSNYHMVVTKEGKVGVGTTSPAQKLQVGSTGDSGSNLIRIANNNGANANPTLSFWRDSAIESTLSLVQNKLVYSVNPADYTTSGLTNTAKFAIDSSGNVGIGTDVPYDKLEVVSGGGDGLQIRSASRPTILFNVTGGAMTQGWVLEVTNEAGVGTAGDFAIREDAKNGGIRFVLQNNTGNVGIGTMSPGFKLHVGPASKPSNSQNSLVGIYSDTSGKYLEVGDGSTLRFYLSNDSSNMTFFINGMSTVFDSPWGGDYFFKTGSSGVSTEKLVIKNGGNVGIGTSSPQSLLHVNSTTSNVYIQLPVNSTALASADCDAEAERGRMIVDGNNVRLHICYGTSGWKTLTPS